MCRQHYLKPHAFYWSLSIKMSDDNFSLSWNEFGGNVLNTFKNLINDANFTDVTLVSEDRKQIKAHKVIISSCSELFSQILLENPHQHPLLFLKGVKHSDLLAIIKFVYLGQTEVAQDDLNHFMESAGSLQIKGLQENKKAVPDYYETNYKTELLQTSFQTNPEVVPEVRLENYYYSLLYVHKLMVQLEDD